jgi:DNA-binding CsgD family transcriptional regulator
MQAHLQSARERKQTRNALDAFGYASITVRERDGRLMWQTPLARELLQRYYAEDSSSADETLRTDYVPEPLLAWLRRSAEHVRKALERGEPLTEPPRLHVDWGGIEGGRRLTFRLHQRNGDDSTPEASHDEWLLIMREESDEALIAALMASCRLTLREAEVLYWVIQGKINRDIADILGSSPATVKKHLERIYVKLGVETRTAAAALATNRIRQSYPQFES